MAVRVQERPFDLGAEVAALTVGRTDVGAIVTFSGVCRDRADSGAQLAALTLEHYPGMTEEELGRIEAEARARWPLADVLVVHRVGRIMPGEMIVLVVTISAHRKAAFEAAEFLMDYLKTSAPFWKSEETADGTNWVAAKGSDDDAADRWKRG
ncbi:molybdenum cofactor biosynthesis protein MoaE [Chelatococcus sambhunathii]|uniref:Molybdopterin synthase catalytic subunit n=1 Tax=Chelatococcus sambhunathii TaxID=363953 RepID=A0ABU1DH05_9HYPH|nr:molybdenum cofactor biosynthesis protein MoaE [Chelatococcus sambhunathii]MDR4307372.1 molybdenum cofactor biosynthesis protein MoaE [Chelatococcus sambhunathii]